MEIPNPILKTFLSDSTRGHVYVLHLIIQLLQRNYIFKNVFKKKSPFWI